VDRRGRFTVLVRQDHAEARGKAAVGQTEGEVEREFGALMRSILARYHEEQVWSDKIPSVSTYGQLAALGVNVLVEPWKRRRLRTSTKMMHTSGEDKGFHLELYPIRCEFASARLHDNLIQACRHCPYGTFRRKWTLTVLSPECTFIKLSSAGPEDQRILYHATHRHRR
jgi:hypothetical protein